MASIVHWPVNYWSILTALHFCLSYAATASAVCSVQ